MKRLFLISIVLALFGGALNAQDSIEKGADLSNEKIVDLREFSEIEIEDDFIITLIQSDSKHGLSENPNIVAEVTGSGHLKIAGTSAYKNRKNRKGREQLTVYFNTLEKLQTSGAVNVKLPKNSSLTGQQLDIEMSGASSADLKLEYDRIRADLSGASRLVLSGVASELSAECSGASNVNASNLQTEFAYVKSSGASTMRIETKKVSGSASGASHVHINPDAESSVSKSGMASVGYVVVNGADVQEKNAYSRSEFEEELVELGKEFAEAMKEMSAELAEWSKEFTEDLTEELAELEEEQAELGEIDTNQIDWKEYGERQKKIAKRQAEIARQQAEYHKELAQRQAEIARKQAERQKKIAKRQAEIARGGKPHVATHFKVHTVSPKKNKITFDPDYPVLDFGFNSYGEDPFQNTLPASHSMMSLSQNTSFVFNINAINCGFRFVSRGRDIFGLGMGLGVGWNIYKFYNKSVVPTVALNPGTLNDEFIALPYAGPEQRENFKKSKLQTFSLKVPVYLIYQQRERFHVSAGVVGNVRLGSSTKQVYDLVGSGKHRTKSKDDFYLSPFRVDAEVRVGYKNFSAFATYALTDMFMKNHGPELTQYSFGISLGV